MMKEFSMHVLDIVQNSIKAKATDIQMTVTESREKNLFSFRIKDNGSGMSKAMLNKVRDPFTTSRTERKVGLGIPMLEQLCGLCGGRLELSSELGVGTELAAIMKLDSIDLPPLGDVAEAVYMTVVTNQDINFIYTHTRDSGEFVFSSEAVREALGGVPFTEPAVMEWIEGFIREGIAEVTSKE